MEHTRDQLTGVPRLAALLRARKPEAAGAAGSATALPPRRIRAPTAYDAPRVGYGWAHGIHLGQTRVRKGFGGKFYGGTVRSFCRPWFRITYDDGDSEDIRGYELAAVVVYHHELLYDPLAHSTDYSVLRPYDMGGWANALRSFVRGFSVALPSAWLEGAGVGSMPNTRGDGNSDFVDTERAILGEALDAMIDGAKASTTYDNLRNYAIKFLSWCASRRVPLPPTARDCAEYLTFMALKCDSPAAVTCSRNAISMIGKINGWNTDAITTGLASAPSAAMARRHRHQVKKSAGLKPKHVKKIIAAYAYVHPGRPVDQQWELAIAIAITIAFKLLLRYDCLCSCKWDDGFCDVYPTHATFYLDKRKNKQARGDRLTVARMADPKESGAYDPVVLGKRVFQKGFVLPAINVSGHIDRSAHMAYKPFVKQLRNALTTTGMATERAAKFAGQSMRSGGATAAAVSGLSSAEISHLAGVSDVNWLVYYNRHHLASRIRASRAVGL